MNTSDVKQTIVAGTPKQRTVKKQDGFTLLDVAIILMVTGLIAAPMLSEYRNWSKRTDLSKTDTNIFQIGQALEQYYFENERYPCPAVATVGANSVIAAGQPEFGQENRDAAGDCIQVGAPQPVLYGAVPFRALNLPEKVALDAWRHKITYAVTTSQTDELTYTNAAGAISITKPNSLQDNAAGAEQTCKPNPFDSNVTNLDLVLLSHGPTGAGAYTSEGNLAQACPVTADIDGDGFNDGEGENCNNDPIFRYPECSISTGANGEFYDDLMYLEYGSGTWNSTPSRMFEEAEDGTSVGSTAGLFGIGHGNPTQAVDVMGNIKATNLDSSTDATDNKKGNALAGQYCDSDGKNCFNPNSIAGDDADMKCVGTNTGVTGFGSNKATCTRLPFNSVSCPTDEFIVGITSTGTLKCSK